MISGSELGSVVSTYLQKTPQVSTQTQPVAPPGPEAGDGISISDQSASVGRVISALHNVPDVRTERVQQVQQRLQSGEAPSSGDVARQILSRVVGDHLAAGS